MVVYQLEGDLRYRSLIEQVGVHGQDPGSVVIKPPDESLEEPVTLGIAANGGGSYPLFARADAGAKWYAMLEAVARVNTRAKNWLRQPAAVELRLGFMGGWLWAQGLEHGEDAGLSVPVAYMRFVGTAHAVFTVWSGLSISVGAGLSYGRPLYNADMDVAPAQLAPLLPSIIVTYHTSRTFAVEGRLLVLYEHGITTELPAYGQQPISSRDWFMNVFGGGGFRFDL